MAIGYNHLRYVLSMFVSARLCCSLVIRTVGRNSSSNQTMQVPWIPSNGTVVTPDVAWPLEKRPPRVFFLFMAVDKISNLGVWEKFFAGGSPSQYRAYAHCKLPQCETQLAKSVIKIIPSVPSYYCTDLVSPMNQLLRWALSDDMKSVNAADKFVFISDSTLPAKPFSQIYSALSGRTGSDFCAFPSNEWADVPGNVQVPNNGVDMAVKYHQWIVLQRDHAEKATDLWASGTLHDFMSRFQMNTQAYNAWSNNTYGDSRNFGCLDEFWHMAAIFGTLHVQAHTNTVVSFSHFTGSPLRVSSQVGWQGQCDTFVMWAKYLHAEGNNPFLRFYQTLDPVSIPHGGNDQRPGWWDTMSNSGIAAIRNSDFLFVRKFIDNPTLSGGGNFGEAYAKIVLV